MDELDEIWQQKMQKAVLHAEISGRNDIAEYLALKMSNDAIRAESSKWLFNSFIEIFQNHHQNALIELETNNPHEFEMKKATIVGSRLRFRHGLRCLDVEAGWTRTPKDGFMRGNALAFAKISHFGMVKNNHELHLKKSETVPQWFVVDVFGNEQLVKLEYLQTHFHIFVS